jgi:hypothetical protein
MSHNSALIKMTGRRGLTDPEPSFERIGSLLTVMDRSCSGCRVPWPLDAVSATTKRASPRSVQYVASKRTYGRSRVLNGLAESPNATDQPIRLGCNLAVRAHRVRRKVQGNGGGTRCVRVFPG